MNRTPISVVVAVVALGLTTLAALPAFAANVAGVIADATGKPVQGMKVIAETQKSQPVQAVLTGSKGGYAIKNLTPGGYLFALEPGGAGFKKGESVAAFVPDEGLTLDWTVSATADPIALARVGTAEQVAAGDPFGLTWAQFALLGGVVVGTGTALGVAAASGGFSGGSGGGSGSVASSSK
jgi:hypothetical protein